MRVLAKFLQMFLLFFAVIRETAVMLCLGLVSSLPVMLVSRLVTSLSLETTALVLVGHKHGTQDADDYGL